MVELGSVVDIQSESESSCIESLCGLAHLVVAGALNVAEETLEAEAAVVLRTACATRVPPMRT